MTFVESFLDIYVDPVFQVIIAVLAGSGLHVSLFFAHRKNLLSTEVIRVTGHILFALVVVIFAPITYKLSMAVSSFFLGFIFLYKIPEYWGNEGKKAGSWGVWVYSFALGLLAILGLETFVVEFQISVLLLGFADPAAMFFGKRFPLQEIEQTGKSMGGTISFIIVGMLVIVVFHLVYPTGFVSSSWLKISIGVVVAGIAEQFSKRGTDNITAPLACFLILVYL